MQPLIAVPCIILLLFRAYSKNSLTPAALLTAGLSASIHALHPSPLPFTLLGVFFLLGTQATKVKHNVKATLTLSSTGSSGGEGPRATIQVLANSGVATALCLVHVLRYGTGSVEGCLGHVPARDLLLAGIVANYAAVTADTLSSELGILSSHKPRLITTLREVPAGTNGGVTGMGLFAGLAGAFVIGVVSVLMLPLCLGKDWLLATETLDGINAGGDVFGMVLAIASWGALGSILDSLLGALLQASVVDRRTGKVVEGIGGGRVIASASPRKGVQAEQKKTDGDASSRFVGSGRDILDNNQINVLMAFLMSIGGIVFAALAWEVPVSSVWT